jgi:NTP pyrophosphatase (non-canonical NTP hydrolase)
MKFNTYQRALMLFGFDNQASIAIEEMAELTKELIKKKRGEFNNKEIIEEIADVQIMISQLSEYFGNKNVQEMIEYKLARLDAIMQQKMRGIK